MQLLLHSTANLLAYVAALLVASFTKVSRSLGADARLCDSNYPGRNFESAAANVASLLSFRISFLIADFCRFLACVCDA